MKNIRGYKAFHNMKDRNGTTYEIGETYTTDEDIKYQSKGFHFCENLVDVFRYYDGFRDDINVCEVIGEGIVDTYEDNYNEYYNMHAASTITILRELSRSEIIDTVIKQNIHSIKRFIAGFKLSEDEINKISDEYKEDIIRDYIEYYQYDNKDTFKKKGR